jgi:very-short-patch-repair endonuclease
MSATRGVFKLNAALPIPFDDRSQMEVDFLGRDARLVIEIDGMQHLSDPESWRRDRRKDVLLQSHGYLILRFLADDLGKRLDEVLDTVLRSVEHLRRGKSAQYPPLTSAPRTSTNWQRMG